MGIHCVICQRNSIRFKSRKNRPHAQCPKCGSKERQRAVLMFLQAATDMFSDRHKHVLFVRPYLEKNLRNIIFQHPFVTAVPTYVDVRDIPEDDESVDYVLHNHIMEHVSADVKAYKEFLRILKPGGTMLFTVPTGTRDEIREQEAIGPVQRKRIYGQGDHVRLYGKQGLVDRLLKCGFAEARFAKLSEYYSKEETDRTGLEPHRGCFIAKKGGTAA